MALSKDYEESLIEDLADPVEAAGYLNASLDAGTEVFLLALRDVAKAHGGMSKLAERTELAREPLYRALSESGNPSFKNVSTVLQALGMQVQLVPSR